MVYVNTNEARWDKGGEEYGVVDLWRYEFKTGKNQKFLIARDGDAGEGLFPPEGLRLFLSMRPNERIEMPEPKWDILVSESKSGGWLWLSDASAIIGEYQDFDRRRAVLEVEVFSPKRKVFAIYPEFSNFLPLFVDDKDRLYMENRDPEKDRINLLENRDKDQISIVRCSIDVNKESLSCETLLEKLPVHAGFDIFSDGETMVFSKMREDNCVRITRVGEEESPCITTEGLTVGSHAVISPDDRWLVFERAQREEAKDFRTDLYIVELKPTKKGQ